MQLTYITKPKENFLTRTKSDGMKYTRTSVQCPLCFGAHDKRKFEAHVFDTHGARVDECFAKLFGLSYPVRCNCGKELHYSRAKKGFPTSCGNCVTRPSNGTEYRSADEAKRAATTFKAQLAFAQAEAKRLAKAAKLDAELSRIPMANLPFPSRKDPRLLIKISKELRTHAVNGDQQKLIALANFIDEKISSL